MSEPKKPKVTFQIHYVYPRDPKDAAPGQFTYDQVKKYLSDKPLRRQPPRPRPKQQDAGEACGQ